MKQGLRYFCLGAAAYPLLEIVWRGRTHWTMSLAGGLALATLSRVARGARKKPLPVRALYGAGIITAIEFVFGCVCNLLLKMRVWNYSAQKGNLLGQICLPYCGLWYLLSLALMRWLPRRG